MPPLIREPASLSSDNVDTGISKIDTGKALDTILTVTTTTGKALSFASSATSLMQETGVAGAAAKEWTKGLAGAGGIITFVGAGATMIKDVQTIRKGRSTKQEIDQQTKAMEAALKDTNSPEEEKIESEQQKIESEQQKIEAVTGFSRTIDKSAKAHVNDYNVKTFSALKNLSTATKGILATMKAFGLKKGLTAGGAWLGVAGGTLGIAKDVAGYVKDSKSNEKLDSLKKKAKQVLEERKSELQKNFPGNRPGILGKQAEITKLDNAIKDSSETLKKKNRWRFGNTVLNTIAIVASIATLAFPPTALLALAVAGVVGAGAVLASAFVDMKIKKLGTEQTQFSQSAQKMSLDILIKDLKTLTTDAELDGKLEAFGLVNPEAKQTMKSLLTRSTPPDGDSPQAINVAKTFEEAATKYLGSHLLGKSNAV
jgi:hypothetical protein